MRLGFVVGCRLYRLLLPLPLLLAGSYMHAQFRATNPDSNTGMLGNTPYTPAQPPQPMSTYGMNARGGGLSQHDRSLRAKAEYSHLLKDTAKIAEIAQKLDPEPPAATGGAASTSTTDKQLAELEKLSREVHRLLTNP